MGDRCGGWSPLRGLSDALCACAVMRKMPLVDKALVNTARVIVTNGLGYEGWIFTAGRCRRDERLAIVSRRMASRRARNGLSWSRRRRSSCVAVGRQCEDLCGQYPRCADRGLSSPARRLTRRIPPLISPDSIHSTRIFLHTRRAHSTRAAARHHQSQRIWLFQGRLRDRFCRAARHLSTETRSSARATWRKSLPRS